MITLVLLPYQYVICMKERQLLQWWWCFYICPARIKRRKTKESKRFWLIMLLQTKNFYTNLCSSLVQRLQQICEPSFSSPIRPNGTSNTIYSHKAEEHFIYTVFLKEAKIRGRETKKTYHIDLLQWNLYSYHDCFPRQVATLSAFSTVFRCSTVRTIPFSFWLFFQTNTAKMEPLYLALSRGKIFLSVVNCTYEYWRDYTAKGKTTYVWVITCDHLPIANLVTETVRWFIWIHRQI